MRRITRFCPAPAVIAAATLLISLSALATSSVAAESIVEAQYADPVERYGHFAPGRPHEYAHLTASTSAGRRVTLQLARDEVFEDVAPRLVTLAPGEAPEILAVVSRRDDGSRLAIVGLRGERLEIVAQSPPTGMPMRWLNPVGVADLDADGRPEIAAVTTPHIGGTLRVYRRSGVELVEIASLAGFSNHIYGSPELGLSAPVAIDGRMHLVVPDTQRLRLRIIALEGDRLVETGRCALPAPITGPIRIVDAARVSVRLPSGKRVIGLKACATAQAGR